MSENGQGTITFVCCKSGLSVHDQWPLCVTREWMDRKSLFLEKNVILRLSSSNESIVRCCGAERQERPGQGGLPLLPIQSCIKSTFIGNTRQKYAVSIRDDVLKVACMESFQAVEALWVWIFALALSQGRSVDTGRPELSALKT